MKYEDLPGIRKSELWNIRLSPEKFKYLLDNPAPSTPNMIFGSAFHKMVLEPNKFDDCYVVMPNVDRRTKEGKAIYEEFEEYSGCRDIIDQEAYDIMCAMHDKLLSVPFAKKLLSGHSEQSIMWTDEITGEKCKGRADVITSINVSTHVVVDLKTSSDASTDSFMRDCIKYGYDMQAAMYKIGADKQYGREHAFVFIAIEKEPPYAVNIMQADELLLMRGTSLFRKYIGIYADCKKTGNWYGYNGENGAVNNLQVPTWAINIDPLG